MNDSNTLKSFTVVTLPSKLIFSENDCNGSLSFTYVYVPSAFKKAVQEFRISSWLVILKLPPGSLLILHPKFWEIKLNDINKVNSKSIFFILKYSDIY